MPVERNRMRWARERGAVAVAALALLLTDGALAAPGDPDPSFGSAGVVVDDLGGFEFGTGVALQADGRVVVVGTTDTGGVSRIALVRYLSSGARDVTFGSGGAVLIDAPTGARPALALQSDGKIVIADRTGTGLVVYRLLPSGAPDAGFGVGGRADVPVFATLEAVGVAVDGSGRLVVGLRVDSLSGINGIVAVRLTSAGAPDSSFGTSGKVELFAPFTRILLDLAVQDDGKIVFAGYTTASLFNVDMLAIRLTEAGLPDPTFGTGGEATVDFAGFWDEAQAVAIDSDGSIVLGGRSFTAVFGSTHWSFAQLTSGGTPDASFGAAGKSVLDPSPGDDVVLSLVIAGDKILATGQTGLPGDLPLARLNDDGTVDGGFGAGGITNHDSWPGGVGGWDLVVQPDGSAITMGTVFSGIASLTDFALARYLEAAPPVVSFSFEGFLSTFKNPPVLNVAQSANVQRLYFRLGGNRGLDVLAPGSPQSRRIDCGTKAPLGPLEPTATPAWDALSYQPSLDRYYYPWKPPKGAGWAGTCREFVLTLADRSEHRAWFRFVS